MPATSCTPWPTSRNTVNSLSPVADSTKSILLVAQLSPPSTLVAARRVAGLTKYWSKSGYRVTVLTSAISGEGPIEGAAEVVRTRDLMASSLNWRRRHFAALGGHVAQSYRRPSRLEAVVVPDLGLLGWIPFALPRAVRLARARVFDCVITSSPPQSTHLIGNVLSKRGLPWIAELRDGWTFDPPRRPWPLVTQRRLDVSLEHRVLQGADALVGVTTPIAHDLRDRFGGSAQVITNGFDPEELGEPEPEDSLLDPTRHSLVYTGRMAVAGRDPTPLFNALRILRDESPELAGRLELVFAGPIADEERGVLTSADLKDSVRILGALDRPRALKLQRAADSLLVLGVGTSNRSVATGKLFEYLAAGRPILVLGEETEAARIVASANAGLAVPAEEPKQIADALRRLAEGRGPNGADRELVARYAYPRIADQYAELIDEVCERRCR